MYAQKLKKLSWYDNGGYNKYKLHVPLTSIERMHRLKRNMNVNEYKKTLYFSYIIVGLRLLY